MDTQYYALWVLAVMAWTLGMFATWAAIFYINELKLQHRAIVDIRGTLMKLLMEERRADGI